MSDDPGTWARGFYDEVINRGNLDAIDDYVHDDFVEHEELPPGIPSGKEGPRVFFEMMRAGFPDLSATIEDVVVEADRVVVRSRMAGTHEGEFLGIPPTHKKFDIGAIDIVRVQDGKATEHWGVMDSMAMMQQLGLAPEGMPSP